MVSCSSISGSIQVGNLIRSIGTFTNALDDYNPIDPSLVYCDVMDPAGVETVYQYTVDVELQKSSTGVYYLEQTLHLSGQWYFRWWSDGNVVCSSEVALLVRDTQTY